MSQTDARRLHVGSDRTRRHIHRRGPRSLQHPVFRTMLLAGVIVFANRYVEGAATSWLAVERTDSAFALTLVSFFRYIPFVVAGPLVGVLADRMPRIRIVRFTDVMMAASTAFIAALLMTDSLQLWHIYLFVTVNGVLWSVGMTARRAYMVGAVGRRLITPALALEMLVWTVCNIVASNATGTVLTAVPAQYAYLWLTVTTLVAVLIMRKLPPLYHSASTEQRPAFMASLNEGLNYARGNRFVLATFAFTAINNATGALFEAMAPVYAREVLHVGSAGLGALLSATAFGALITGGVLAVAGGRIVRPGLAVLGAGLAIHVLTVAWSFATVCPLSFGILAVAGLFTILFGTMNTRLMLDSTPDNMRGRVQGLQFFLVGLYPISSLLVGWLSDTIGPGPAVRYMALFGVGALVAVLLAFPELRRRPGDDAGPVEGRPSPSPVARQA